MPTTELDVNSLLQKAKPEAAATIKRKCALSVQKDLHRVLDVLLNISNSIDDEETIEWCRWLIAGGLTPDEFSANIRLYDKSTSCRSVWTENFVAYRCRTCGISPFMSLCSECFQHGNHEGHDFIMFRSETGGTCDCGEINVIKESGCCFLHGPAQLCGSRSSQHCIQNGDHSPPNDIINNNNGITEHSGKPTNSAPPELLFIADEMMPRLFWRLVQHMRKTGFSNQPHHSGKFIKMLQDFSDMGAAMTRVMVLTLTSSQVYSNLTKMMNEKETLDNFIKCLASRSGNPPLVSAGISKIQIPTHNSFLEELLFWTTILEFPDDLVTLLLSMRSDLDYKEAFTKAFAMHYRLIPTLILNSGDPDKFCKRMTSISVQLFSIETLAIQMIQQTDLLHFLMDSLASMIESTRNSAGEIDLKHSIMTNNQYWPIQSDLKELLSHVPVAEKFCEDPSLLGKWVSLIGSLHGMNPNIYLCKSEPHMESETNGGVESFTAELGLCAAPMWGFISHFKNSSHAQLTKNVINCCWEQVKMITRKNRQKGQQMSFHLPLFRYIAAFIYQGVSQQKLSLKSILFPPKDDNSSLFKTVFHELIRVQAVFHQVRNRLWPRNGSQMMDQAVFYVDSSCCTSMIDLDIFFLQVSVVHMPPKEFWMTSIRQFLVSSFFLCNENLSSRELELESDERIKMLESFLTFIASLVSVRNYLSGTNNEAVDSLELCTLLCQSDKTHSQLMELMPSRCSTDGQVKNFDILLDEFADFVPPKLEVTGTLAQGTYKPKSIVWDNMFCPIHVLLRSSNLSDFQASRDRFLDYCKRTKKCTMKEECLWPPFKIPSEISSGFQDPITILNCRYFHAIAFVLLHKAVVDIRLPEFITSLVIHLLQLTVIDYSKQCRQTGNTENTQNGESHVNDEFPFFSGDDFSKNLFTVIPSYGDSLITLLFKLLKKISREGLTLDSFSYGSHSGNNDTHYGDGEFYITKLLHHIASCSTMTSNFFHELNSAVSKIAFENESQNGASTSKLKEKQALARQRKEQLMKQFAKIRQDFINQTTLANESEEIISCDKEISSKPTEIEFHCVICMEKGPSIESNPFGLVVSLTSSDILRHRWFENEENTIHHYFKDDGKTLLTQVEQYASTFSVNTTFPICREGGGVHVRTCGHHLHMDCLNSYLDSLSRGDQVNPSKSKQCQPIVEKFTCPMCRQVAHSFLPVLPSHLIATKPQTQSDDESDETKILHLLKKRSKNVTRLSLKLTEAIGKFVTDLNRKLNGSIQEDNERSPNEDYLLALHLQTNIEIELCIEPKVNNACLSSLPDMMHALQVRYKGLPSKQGKKLAQLWENICGVICSDDKSVPLLLRDPFSILVHIVLQLGSQNISENLFSVITQKVFSLCLVQSVCSLLWKENINKPVDCDSFADLLISSIQQVVANEGCNVNENSIKIRDQVRNQVALFLKKSCVLKHCLGGSAFGVSKMCELEDFFKYLFIEMKSLPDSFVKTLCKGVIEFNHSHSTIVESLLTFQCSVWNRPKLIKLPEKFDELYQKMAKFTCSVCNCSPEFPGICLLCGTILCLGSNCCEDEITGVWEGVSHARQCGSGNSIILCVATSNIAVIGKKQACYWGSVYLDSFGEEDIGLKRGKPLYLCNDRYQFLEKEWIHFAFQKTFRRWFTHCDKL